MSLVVDVGVPLASTYEALKADAEDWLVDDEATDKIPAFIRLAESNIARDIRTTDMETRLSATIGASAYTLPADFLSMRSIYIDGTNRNLDFLHLDGLLRSEARGITANPTAYSIDGRRLVFAPVPSVPVDIEMTYFKRYAALNDDADTNALIRDHYDVYLYSTLMHGFSYLRDDEQASKYAKQYALSVAETNRLYRRSRHNASQMVRTGGVTT